MTIRRVREADAAALAILHGAAFPQQPWGPEFWRAAAVRDDSCCWAYLDQDAVLGAIALRWVAGEAEILTLAVCPRQRRRGIGQALLTEAITHFRATAVQELFLEVEATNRAATALYRKAGFDEVGRRNGYYGKGRDALILRLSVEN